MLTRKESELMKVVYALCGEEGRCLVMPSEICRLLPKRYSANTEWLEKGLQSLVIEGYFDVLSSQRKGEKMYVITLTNLGLSFLREHHNKRRNVALKLGWSILSAVIAFLVGLLLKKIF
jgi:hypothetical protein